jgi:hypothetical protein
VLLGAWWAHGKGAQDPTLCQQKAEQERRKKKRRGKEGGKETGKLIDKDRERKKTDEHL